MLFSRFIVFYVVAREIAFAIPQVKGDKNIYTFLHGRNKDLLDYSDFLNNHTQEDGWQGFDRVESIFAVNKFSAPPTVYSHTPGEEKITTLT